MLTPDPCGQARHNSEGKKNNMPNGNIDFVLGQVLARLSVNDEDHKEIKELLKEMTAAQTICNNKVIALETRAKVWGGIAGFIVAAIISAVGWIIKH